MNIKLGELAKESTKEDLQLINSYVESSVSVYIKN